MGAAARKTAPVQTRQHARPSLTLLPGGRRHTRARAHASASHTFRLVVACMSVLALAGLVRVSLAAGAAEGAVDAWNLRSQVKAERLITRALESDKSYLAAPSRVEAVACETLNMCAPTEVAHLDLAQDAAAPDAAAAESVSGGADVPDRIGTVLSTMLDLAAGEAQVLVVGDMGLGSL